MNKYNTIGVNLAKNVIQVCVVSATNIQLANKELTRKKSAEFFIKQKPALVTFEACATAHYWSRVPRHHGHETKIIPALAVAPFRQGYKTDQNDALAVAEAAIRPNIKEAPIKTVEQQSVQAIQRSRELLIQSRTELSNHIRGLLMEFGLVIPRGFASLYENIRWILEDGENELADSYRPTLNLLYQRLYVLRDDLAFLDKQIAGVVNEKCSVSSFDTA